MSTTSTLNVLSKLTACSPLPGAAQQGLGIALIPMPISQSWFDEGVIMPLFEERLVTRDKYYLIQHDWHASREELDLFVQWMLKVFTK